MICKCANPQCGTLFEAFKWRKYCCGRCYQNMLNAARREEHKHVEVVRVSDAKPGKPPVVLTPKGVIDTFYYVRAIRCACGEATIHNPHALPENRSASGKWRDIDVESGTAVCPKCAEKVPA